MERFKKAYKRFIALVIACALFFNSTVYGVGFSDLGQLRVPLRRYEPRDGEITNPTVFPDKVFEEANQKVGKLLRENFPRIHRNIPRKAYIRLVEIIANGMPEEWLQHHLLMESVRIDLGKMDNDKWLIWIESVIKKANGERESVNEMLRSIDYKNVDKTWSGRLDITLRYIEEMPGLKALLLESESKCKVLAVSAGFWPFTTIDWAERWKEKFPNVLILGSDFTIGHEGVEKKHEYPAYLVMLSENRGLVAFSINGKVVYRAYPKEVKEEERPSDKELEGLFKKQKIDSSPENLIQKDAYENIWVRHPIGQNGYGERLKKVLAPELTNLMLLDCPFMGRLKMPDEPEFKVEVLRSMNNLKKAKTDQDREEVQLAIDYLGTTYISEEGYLIEGHGGREKNGGSLKIVFNLHKKEPSPNGMAPKELCFSIFGQERTWMASSLKGMIRNPDFRKAMREEKELNNLIDSILSNPELKPWHKISDVTDRVVKGLIAEGYNVQKKDFEEGILISIQYQKGRTLKQNILVDESLIFNPTQEKKTEMGI